MVLAAGGGQPLNFLGQELGAGRGQFNPGVPRWVAYAFDDSGRREIYVQAFEPGKPASSARWQISDSGGTQPGGGATARSGAGFERWRRIPLLDLAIPVQGQRRPKCGHRILNTTCRGTRERQYKAR